MDAFASGGGVPAKINLPQSKIRHKFLRNISETGIVKANL